MAAGRPPGVFTFSRISRCRYRRASEHSAGPGINDVAAMKTVISSDDLKSKDIFQTYREIVREHFVPSETRQMGEGRFHAHIEATRIGENVITRSSFNGQSIKITPQTIRQHDKQDFLSIVLRVSGTARSAQYDRSIIQRPGDIVLFDSARPVDFEYPDDTQSIFIELPRKPIEAMLGSAALYAGMAIDGRSAGAVMAQGFFENLLRVEESLTPDMAQRMMGIGTDLLIANLAERMAQEPPASVQSTLIVQRAKAYVDANIDRPTLSPAEIAMATGVSLRHLQQLFTDRGIRIAEWLWHRRLQIAARRLTDPRNAHVPIGTLAYACGFNSQSHFNRRFKDHFQVSPTEYRWAALSKAA